MTLLINHSINQSTEVLTPFVILKRSSTSCIVLANGHCSRVVPKTLRLHIIFLEKAKQVMTMVKLQANTKGIF